MGEKLLSYQVLGFSLLSLLELADVDGIGMRICKADNDRMLCLSTSAICISNYPGSLHRIVCPYKAICFLHEKYVEGLGCERGLIYGGSEYPSTWSVGY